MSEELYCDGENVSQANYPRRSQRISQRISQQFSQSYEKYFKVEKKRKRTSQFRENKIVDCCKMSEDIGKKRKLTPNENSIGNLGLSNENKLSIKQQTLKAEINKRVESNTKEKTKPLPIPMPVMQANKKSKIADHNFNLPEIKNLGLSKENNLSIKKKTLQTEIDKRIESNAKEKTMPSTAMQADKNSKIAAHKVTFNLPENLPSQPKTRPGRPKKAINTIEPISFNNQKDKNIEKPRRGRPKKAINIESISINNQKNKNIEKPSTKETTIKKANIISTSQNQNEKQKEKTTRKRKAESLQNSERCSCPQIQPTPFKERFIPFIHSLDPLAYDNSLLKPTRIETINNFQSSSIPSVINAAPSQAMKNNSVFYSIKPLSLNQINNLSTNENNLQNTFDNDNMDNSPDITDIDNISDILKTNNILYKLNEAQVDSLAYKLNINTEYLHELLKRVLCLSPQFLKIFFNTINAIELYGGSNEETNIFSNASEESIDAIIDASPSSKNYRIFPSQRYRVQAENK